MTNTWPIRLAVGVTGACAGGETGAGDTAAEGPPVELAASLAPPQPVSRQARKVARMPLVSQFNLESRMMAMIQGRGKPNEVAIVRRELMPGTPLMPGTLPVMEPEHTPPNGPCGTE